MCRALIRDPGFHSSGTVARSKDSDRSKSDYEVHPCRWMDAAEDEDPDEEGQM